MCVPNFFAISNAEELELIFFKKLHLIKCGMNKGYTFRTIDLLSDIEQKIEKSGFVRL
jgi:hypothetical protein